MECGEEAAGGAVLVTAENLSRLMGLSGETLVKTHALADFTQRLKNLKGSQQSLGEALGELRALYNSPETPASAQRALAAALAAQGQCQEQLARDLEFMEFYSLGWEKLAAELYNEAIGTRMRPFKDGIAGFPRLVRDMSRRTGKKIRLKVSGEGTRVDRDVLSKLEAPLSHILRNACDHGVEEPAQREKAGKPAQATVELKAYHKAGMLNIVVADDGAGVDCEHLREKVAAQGLVAEDMAARLSEAELLEFLFLPGFSTAAQVTEISGRGVGLDVVQDMVRQVGGTVELTSQSGKGARFHLQLPLTLSVIRTLIVDIAGEPYAFPLTRVERVLALDRQEVQVVQDRQYLSLDGENVGLVSARQPLQLGRPDGWDEKLCVVVISNRLTRYGLVVDGLAGEKSLVVRPLDARLGTVPNLAAAAVMEDGSPVLILDAEGLVDSIDHLLSRVKPDKLGGAAAIAAAIASKRILVVDDSITVREVERKILENAGYQVDLAVDGLDGWSALRSGRYDLVISDVDMPRMNGIELVTKIKEDRDLKELPVVMVSYKDRTEDRLRGLEAGANYYLTKSSFKGDGLINAVEDLIGEP